MSRIQRLGTWATVIVLALLYAGDALAGEKPGIRRGGHRRTVADHVVAYAALDALPGETGWGRFVVRDDLLPSGDERSVVVSLFGLEPRAEYMVEADGVEVGTIFTDRRGDASLKLKTRGRGSDDVPSELPSADAILEASVSHVLGHMVLDGAFTVIREHVTDPTVHSEKIRLEAEEGFDAEGMAGVCRKESGAQGFVTLVAGLEPGLSYSIVVDTIVVGIVTADEEGQAGLELRVPDDENPLPDAMQPVDNIRNVQWFQGDLLILSGVFTGESDTDDRCHEFEGQFVQLTDDGFVLRKHDVDVEIVVTDETEFEGFDDLAELEEGDRLEVEACWDGEDLVATSVELEELERECDELRGEVVSRTDNGFVLQTGDDRVEVVVTDETRFKGFDSLDDLDGGEYVSLEGCFDGDVIVAWWVRLLEDDDCAELRGVVAERTDIGFVLQVGEDFVHIAVTDETELKGFESLDQLDGGEVVALEGCFDGDVLVAVWVCLVEDDACAELHGVVAERTDIGFVLQVGEDFVGVAVTEATVLKNFESLEDLEIGVSVTVEGCFDGEVLVAVWVSLHEEEPELEWWVADGTVVDLLDYGFAFEADGEVVIVKITDETALDGYENADQIAEDDVVLVEGWWDGEKVFAERVTRGGQ